MSEKDSAGEKAEGLGCGLVCSWELQPRVTDVLFHAQRVQVSPIDFSCSLLGPWWGFSVPLVLAAFSPELEADFHARCGNLCLTSDFPDLHLVLGEQLAQWPALGIEGYDQAGDAFRDVAVSLQSWLGLGGC